MENNQPGNSTTTDQTVASIPASQDTSIQVSQGDKVKRGWADLTTEEKNGVLALCLARSTNEAARIFKMTTGRSRPHFYRRIYPEIKDIWRDVTTGLPDEALRILRGGSLAAAYELVEEVKHRDVRVRNKASNDILDRVMTRPIVPSFAGQINKDGVKFVVFDGSEGNYPKPERAQPIEEVVRLPETE